MTTELLLDFEKVRDSDEPLPEIGVADFIPFKRDGRAELKPVKGIVLELWNREVLKRGIKVPAGPGMFYVRLPTGEALAERVEIVPTQGRTTGTLKLTVAGLSDRVERTTQIIRSFSSETIGEVVGDFHAPSDNVERADRSRWSTVRFDNPQPGQRPLLQLSALLKPFATKVVEERQGNQGIAELESSARTVALNKELWSSVGFDTAFVGEVQAAKPTKLYGSRDELRASWKRRLKPSQLEEKDRMERYFALSFRAEDEPVPLQIACVPTRWRTLSGESARLSVQYISNHSSSYPRGSRMVVGVDDPKFSALLQFMQTGDLASSVSLLQEAEDALFAKFTNPYAAAAGGYVLNHAGYPIGKQNWGRWLHSLATLFPDIPDGQILLANLILQGPEACKAGIPDYESSNAWQIALASVLESVRRGPPVYRFGLRMLSGSIAILNHLVGPDHESREQLDTAADYVRKLSVRVDRNQPFCVFDVGRNAP